MILHGRNRSDFTINASIGCVFCNQRKRWLRVLKKLLLSSAYFYAFILCNQFITDYRYILGGLEYFYSRCFDSMCSFQGAVCVTVYIVTPEQPVLTVCFGKYISAGKLLGLPAATVGTRLARGRERLRQMLKEEEL